MTALARYLMLSSGLTRLAVAFAAGALGALAMPPLYVLPALFAGMTLLVWLLDGAEHKRSLTGRLLGPAFRIGWAFGTGYFLVSMHWVGLAFLVEPGLTGWLMPLGLIAGALVLGLSFGFGSALAHWMWADGGHRILTLAAWLSVTEWLRGHLFAGLPWNLPGYALAVTDPMLQSASVIGVYGYTFVVLLAACTPALIWPADTRTIGRRLGPLVAAVGVLAGMFGFGLWRLAVTEIVPMPGIQLRVVQPNIAQADKWRPDKAEEIFRSLLDLSAGRTGPNDPGLAAVTHLIWPESVFPFIVAAHPDALARIARLLPPDTLLLAGAAREDHASGPGPDGVLPVFNSIIAINDVGEIVASYDKLRLVPFGEYVPFGSLFGALGLTGLVAAQSNFVPGERSPRPFAPYATPPMLPLICYEAIFSGDLGPGADAAQWILNLTNDAWFSGSIGPAQHFAHARLRAVEEGLSLVRLANTGISAVIDPLGRVTARLPANQVAVVDTTLSAPVNRTIFARYRSRGLGLILVIGFAIALLRNFAERRERRSV